MWDRIKIPKAITMFSGTADTKACRLRLNALTAVTESKMAAAKPEVITVPVACKIEM